MTEAAVLLVLYITMYSLPLISSQRAAHFIQTKFINETSKTSHEVDNAPTGEIFSLGHCAGACRSAEKCTRLKFCQERYGLDGKCTLYQSGRDCIRDPEDVGECSCYMLQFSVNERGECQTCPVGYHGSSGNVCCTQVIQDCTEGQGMNHLRDRGDVLSFIKPLQYSGEPFEVVCHFGYGGFTFIQGSKAEGVAVNFNRPWADYMSGFGNVEGSYWLGFDKIVPLLNLSATYQVDLGFFRKSDNKECIIVLDDFSLEESNGFRVTHNPIINYVDGWCLPYKDKLDIKGHSFSTFDNDATDYNCSIQMQAGWWYRNDPNCVNTTILNADHLYPEIKNMAIKVGRR